MEQGSAAPQPPERFPVGSCTPLPGGVNTDPPNAEQTRLLGPLEKKSMGKISLLESPPGSQVMVMLLR